MRVLHLHSGNLFGGTETLLVTLARHGREREGLEFDFGLCFEGRLADQLRQAGYTPPILGPVRTSRPATTLRARRALAAYVARQRADVVICHSPWILAVLGPTVRRAGIPLVMWLHDALRERHWIHAWARRTPPDLVICNSRYTSGTLPTLFENVPAAVVYCPVDPLPEVDESDRSAVRAELRTPEDAVVTIQVGRMEHFKGYHAHIEALAGAVSPGRPIVSWIVGGSQRPEEERYEGELRQRVADLGLEGRVRFVGQRSDVARLLQAADVYCQPNVLPEPFGIAIVEALYAGLPVITTNFGGAAEIVTGDCGVLVPPDDRKSLSSAILRLAESDETRRSLATNGPARAAEISDAGRVLGQLAKTLETVVTSPQ